jgi:hypothetical protein
VVKKKKLSPVETHLEHAHQAALRGASWIGFMLVKKRLRRDELQAAQLGLREALDWLARLPV